MTEINYISLTSNNPIPLQFMIINNQNVDTSSGFQQLFQLNISQLQYYNSNLASDLHNIRFLYNGNYIPAWLESINNGVATIWVKLPISIPANSSITIDMEVDPSLDFDGVYWGEAPQLSPTYGQYDNGNEIFPYYQRFGSLSSLPPDWYSISGTGLTFAPTYIEIEANQTTGGWYGIYLNPIPSSLASTTTVWEFYGNMYDSVNAGSYVGTDTSNSGTFNGYSIAEGTYTHTSLLFLGNGGSATSYSTGYDDTNNNKTYTMQINSATSLQIFVNYKQIYSTTSAISESPTYFDIAPSNNGGSLPATPIYLYWLRTRAYPPNGVMPSVEVIA